MLVYAIEFGKHYKEPSKIKEFRNSVIHKGMIPSLEKANDFAANIYSTVFLLYHRLHDKDANHIMTIKMQDLAEKQAKLAAGMPFATNTTTMFFNNAKASTEPDFAKALDGFKQARQMIAGAIPHMQVLHAALSVCPGTY